MPSGRVEFRYKYHPLIHLSREWKGVCVLKSRGITLPTKVHTVKAMVFPVVTYGCENWAVKKAEHQKIDAFQLWCWRRLPRVPWTARSNNWS